MNILCGASSTSDSAPSRVVVMIRPRGRGERRLEKAVLSGRSVAKGHLKRDDDDEDAAFQ